MLIVVGANVICSGLLAGGKTIDLLFSDKLEPVAPELLFSEFGEHKSEILNKSKLSERAFEAILALIKKHIRIIPSSEFADKLEEANRVLFPHTKDTEYLALAIKPGCPLWSKEKRLKELGIVEVLDADEVERMLSL